MFCFRIKFTPIGMDTFPQHPAQAAVDLPVQVAIDSVRFRDIVGEEKWLALSEFNPDMSCSSDFGFLYQIFQELTFSQNTNSLQTVDGHSQTENDDLSVEEVIYSKAPNRLYNRN